MLHQGAGEIRATCNKALFQKVLQEGHAIQGTLHVRVGRRTAQQRRQGRVGMGEGRAKGFELLQLGLK